MTIVAPYFSARARARRRALRAARAARPHAVVGLVLSHPVPGPATDGFRQPDLLVADRSGVRILSLDGSRTVSSAGWSALPTVEAVLLDVATPVLTVGDARYYGLHGSGAFGLSIAQLRRFAARVEAQRT